MMVGDSWQLKICLSLFTVSFAGVPAVPLWCTNSEYYSRTGNSGTGSHWSSPVALKYLYLEVPSIVLVSLQAWEAYYFPLPHRYPSVLSGRLDRSSVALFLNNFPVAWQDKGGKLPDTCSSCLKMGVLFLLLWPCLQNLPSTRKALVPAAPPPPALCLSILLPDRATVLEHSVKPEKLCRGSSALHNVRAVLPVAPFVLPKFCGSRGEAEHLLPKELAHLQRQSQDARALGCVYKLSLSAHNYSKNLSIMCNTHLQGTQVTQWFLFTCNTKEFL